MRDGRERGWVGGWVSGWVGRWMGGVGELVWMWVGVCLRVNTVETFVKCISGTFSPNCYGFCLKQ